MGITGELVKSVFSRNRVGANESNVRSNNGEKRRWRHVRSYLCGDEFNSVLAEEDSASVKSSEATVTQPIHEELTETIDIKREDTVEISQQKNTGLESKSLHEEAAVIIQSAFRAFLSRRKMRVVGLECNGIQEPRSAGESPSRESLGTSIEVQTGNSTHEAFSNEGDKVGFHSLLQQKATTLARKKKEDWDDSPLSSNVLKMRIQNKLEAMTRRERALAYAFSQQLRICSKKNPTKCNESDPNIGWSWLERWMATRNPEISSLESYVNKQHEIMKMNQRVTVQKRFSEITGEEKESCGSNEVPIQTDNISVTYPEEKGSCSPSKNSLHNRRTVSSRKTVPSSTSMIKDCSNTTMSKVGENSKLRKKRRQAGSKREIKVISAPKK